MTAQIMRYSAVLAVAWLVLCSGLASPASASCSDGSKDGSESDIDCGGSCAKCADGATCASNGDCWSNVCGGGICSVPSCGDGVKNNWETDVDCGGGGRPVSQDGTCRDAHALGAVCSFGLCCDLAGACGSTCTYGGEFTAACTPCDDNKACLTGGDCTSLVCSGSVCAAATCSDGVMNSDETGVDCGGSCTAACAAGAACLTASDCASEVCSNGICAEASCTDGVKNGNEVATDCGGGCAGCADGTACSAAADCWGGSCTGSVCAGNFETPTFPQASYTASVPDTATTDGTIITVAAADSDAGVNGQLRYSIVAGNEAGYFSVTASTGKLHVTRGLDGGVPELTTLTVAVQDLGLPSRSSTVAITVSVLRYSVKVTAVQEPLVVGSAADLRVAVSIPVGHSPGLAVGLAAAAAAGSTPQFLRLLSVTSIVASSPHVSSSCGGWDAVAATASVNATGTGMAVQLCNVTNADPAGDQLVTVRVAATVLAMPGSAGNQASTATAPVIGTASTAPLLAAGADAFTSIGHLPVAAPAVVVLAGPLTSLDPVATGVAAVMNVSVTTSDVDAAAPAASTVPATKVKMLALLPSSKVRFDTGRFAGLNGGHVVLLSHEQGVAFESLAVNMTAADAPGLPDAPASSVDVVTLELQSVPVGSQQAVVLPIEATRGSGAPVAVRVGLAIAATGAGTGYASTGAVTLPVACDEASSCSGHGACAATGTSFRCACQDAWQGTNCDAATTLCGEGATGFSVSIELPAIKASGYQTFFLSVAASLLLVTFVRLALCCQAGWIRGPEHAEEVPQLERNWRNVVMLSWMCLEGMLCVSPAFVANIPWFAYLPVKLLSRTWTTVAIRSLYPLLALTGLAMLLPVLLYLWARCPRHASASAGKQQAKTMDKAHNLALTANQVVWSENTPQNVEGGGTSRKTGRYIRTNCSFWSTSRHPSGAAACLLYTLPTLLFIPLFMAPLRLVTCSFPFTAFASASQCPEVLQCWELPHLVVACCACLVLCLLLGLSTVGWSRMQRIDSGLGVDEDADASTSLAPQAQLQLQLSNTGIFAAALAKVLGAWSLLLWEDSPVLPAVVCSAVCSAMFVLVSITHPVSLRRFNSYLSASYALGAVTGWLLLAVHYLKEHSAILDAGAVEGGGVGDNYELNLLWSTRVVGVAAAWVLSLAVIAVYFCMGHNTYDALSVFAPKRRQATPSSPNWSGSFKRTGDWHMLSTKSAGSGGAGAEAEGLLNKAGGGKQGVGAGKGKGKGDMLAAGVAAGIGSGAGAGAGVGVGAGGSHMAELTMPSRASTSTRNGGGGSIMSQSVAGGEAQDEFKATPPPQFMSLQLENLSGSLDEAMLRSANLTPSDQTGKRSRSRSRVRRVSDALFHEGEQAAAHAEAHARAVADANAAREERHAHRRARHSAHSSVQ